jgi:multimeric flavodoxin WrbA
MKVLAINSSLRTEGESRTELMLGHLVKGMREAGAEVEVINLREKTIKYCIGCFTCSTKTPGQCCLKDDMTAELFPKWLESDIVVYATPLFYRTVNAPLKAFLERTWPSIEPFLVPGDARTSHPHRGRMPATVMLSVCGFPERAEFNALSTYVHDLFRNGVLAEIYRPAAMGLTQPLPGFEQACADVLDATEQAGRELVQTRKVSAETMARIDQPVTDRVVMARVANMFWKTCIEDGLTPKMFEQRKMIPRPYSVEDMMLLLPMGAQAATARDGATLQFNFTGQVEGSCYFRVEGGTLKAEQGKAQKADLTIDAPFESWVAIMTGTANPMELFMGGTCRANGDLSLMGMFRA